MKKRPPRPGSGRRVSTSNPGGSADHWRQPAGGAGPARLQLLQCSCSRGAEPRGSSHPFRPVPWSSEPHERHHRLQGQLDPGGRRNRPWARRAVYFRDLGGPGRRGARSVHRRQQHRDSGGERSGVWVHGAADGCRSERWSFSASTMRTTRCTAGSISPT